MCLSFLKTCVRRSMTSRIILVLVCIVKRCRGTVGSPEREKVFYLQNVDERRPVGHMRQRARGCLRRNISETVNSHGAHRCRWEYLLDRAHTGVKDPWWKDILTKVTCFTITNVLPSLCQLYILVLSNTNVRLGIETLDGRYLCENIRCVGWRANQSEVLNNREWNFKKWTTPQT